MLAVDVADDLALIDTEMPSPEVAKFQSPPMLDPGKFAAAIGYPDLGLPPREPIITAGTMVRPSPGEPLTGAILLKADVRHGNSGGPVIEAHGLVIGVMRAKFNTALVYGRTGDLMPDEGIGISATVVLRFLKENGVQYQIGQEDAALDPDQLLARARSYVARADCWN